MIETKAIFGPNARTQLLLHAGHMGGQHRADVGAVRIDECDGDHLAAKVVQRHRRAVLRYQGKVRRRSDRRQALVVRRVMRMCRPGNAAPVARCACRPPAHVFNSRLTSLRNRQSVPFAMISLGLDLTIPASCSRSEKNLIVSSGSKSRQLEYGSSRSDCTA